MLVRLQLLRQCANPCARLTKRVAGRARRGRKAYAVTAGKDRHLTQSVMEIKPMKSEIEKAIKILVAKATEDTRDGGEALRYSQAALNLAHAAQVMSQVIEK